jgi:hypothetical protein
MAACPAVAAHVEHPVERASRHRSLKRGSIVSIGDDLFGSFHGLVRG